MVVGSDRVREFETILNKYNDVRSRHGYYNFDNINVLSAGRKRSRRRRIRYECK